MKKILLATFISILAISFLSPHIMNIFLEESAFYWNWTKDRDYKAKNYKLIILGDSQWISGLNLDEFSKISNINQDDILIIAKPSQQPEGIELDLDEIWSKGIQSDIYWINLSPTNVTKSDVYQAHKPLQLNFGRKSYRILWKTDLWKSYYTDASSFLFHLVSIAFPIVVFNSQVSAPARILPMVDGINSDSNILQDVLGRDPIQILKERRKNNEYLISILPKQGLWEWRNYEGSSKECNGKDIRAKLPKEMGLAFSNIRKTSIDSLIRIQSQIHRRNEKTIFVKIPFSPEMEELETIFPIVWNDLTKQATDAEFIEVPNEIFDTGDFTDYTHLNSCGSTKLSRWLGKKL
ncbi:hypothetical protein [Leptospira sp. GIMC2001]|uniref:hypothetical protein n=1 Tax=Leptospira sp. GIMC2001 TaxID=1513297 RepID=UPI00234A4764|nr:hypothetical protein [Leptospira sp. GIMC2001]WCL48919.1 hypothetical protein O4O04_16720 [Leptospira sp. GIMC2001]